MKFTGETAFDLSGGFIIWEPIVSDNTPVVLSSGLGGPGPVWFAEVNVEKASPDSKAIIPLKSIHQRPGRVAKYLHTIKFNSCKRKHSCKNRKFFFTEFINCLHFIWLSTYSLTLQDLVDKPLH